MIEYKVFQPVCDSTQKSGKIELREEQKQAVKQAKAKFGKTLADGTFVPKDTSQKFLWNAKMRFGKTICAMQLVKEMGHKRTLIVTHRPVVNKGFHEDFEKIFEKSSTYRYGSKLENEETNSFEELEKYVQAEGNHYIFFASMQYLRRSTLVGGNDEDELKKSILNTNWDLVVVDEAHEGTSTDLGDSVITRLNKKGTKMLFLSGTPFNLYDKFGASDTYTWDYLQEQQKKEEWAEKYPLEPNPYAELPKMHICTYNLGELLNSFVEGGGEFKFSEFFRTWTGKEQKWEDNPMPKELKGRFVHEDAIKKFLGKLYEESADSNYPFSTENYQENFHHTLWIVPGVREAKAMKQLLMEDPVFRNFNIINVAGNDNEERSDALQSVEQAIGNMPQNTYTITLSCGRLTTGVTVKPWTAVLYMKGSQMTSASTYMQTIFRVQSPYTYEDYSGKKHMKAHCFVFDFSPERSIKMVAETAKFSSHVSTKKKDGDMSQTERDKAVMEEFLKCCQVIALDGGAMPEYGVDKLFGQLEKVYVDRLVLSGFDDNCLYNTEELLNIDSEALNKLGKKVAEITNTTNSRPKVTPSSLLQLNGLTEEQKRLAAEARRKLKKGHKEKDLSPEELAAREAVRKAKEEARKERNARIGNIKGIALRVPLLMFGGADLGNNKEKLTIHNFTRLISDESWREFMGKITKDDFKFISKCFNETRFENAGQRYRDLAGEADDMHILERIQRITDIHACFRNPDKETVLTPWRVVNMHMSDTLGGYTFLNERFDGPNEVEKPGENGELFEWVPTLEPRFVDRGEVTSNVFAHRDPKSQELDSKILEINSKTGLYPLYVAYSLYRERCADYVRVGKLLANDDNMSIEEEQIIWDDVLANNIYVICNTPMAQRITHRTLLGFRELHQKNGTEQVNIKSEKLISRAIDDRESLIKDLLSEGFWRGDKRNKNMLKFAAVVGNPPYQVMDGGAQASATPVYQDFVGIAKGLQPNFISMIMPTRWYAGGRGLDDFREEMLNDQHIHTIHDFLSPDSIFQGTNIRGGICFFLWSASYNNKLDLVKVVTHDKDGNSREMKRPMRVPGFDIFIRDASCLSIIDKVKAAKQTSLEEAISPLRPFGFRGYFINDAAFRPSAEGLTQPIICYGKGKKEGFVERDEITVHTEWIDECKVYMPRANNIGTELNDDNLNGFVGRPKTICTESYLVVGGGMDLSEQECSNICRYFKTRFARYMHSLAKASQDATSKTFKFVPLQDFTSSSDIDWSQSIADIDRQLYKKYGLSDAEVSFIERMIKPME